jgi:hypothetical protein
MRGWVAGGPVSNWGSAGTQPARNRAFASRTGFNAWKAHHKRSPYDFEITDIDGDQIPEAVVWADNAHTAPIAVNGWGQKGSKARLYMSPDFDDGEGGHIDYWEHDAREFKKHKDAYYGGSIKETVRGFGKGVVKPIYDAELPPWVQATDAEGNLLWKVNKKTGKKSPMWRKDAHGKKIPIPENIEKRKRVPASRLYGLVARHLAGDALDQEYLGAYAEANGIPLNSEEAVRRATIGLHNTKEYKRLFENKLRALDKVGTDEKHPQHAEARGLVIGATGGVFHHLLNESVRMAAEQGMRLPHRHHRDKSLTAADFLAPNTFAEMTPLPDDDDADFLS